MGVDPARRSVEWYAPGASEFERTDGSRLLDITEQSVIEIIDWPPLDS